MKRLLSLALAWVLALSLTACGGTEPPAASQSQPPDASVSEQEQVPVDIPFALAVYPAYSLHPVLAENRANLTLAPLLYEPLFQLDRNFQPQPVLCKSYAVSEDGLTWTFTLRGGILFSDGTPFDGKNAAEALNAARKAGFRYAARLSGVTAVTGEENILTITLSRPNSQLPALLDIPIAYGAGDRPAGTGPYVLTEGENGLSLTARPDWWQNTALPAREIPMTGVERSDDLIASFASGDTGLVDVDLMGTNALGYSGNYETWDYSTTDLLYVGFNTQKGVCRTAQARQALALAIDRVSIVQIDYARHAVASALPFHPDYELYDGEQAGMLDYDPEELVARLEEQRLLGKRLTLLVNSENAAKVSAAQRIAYQLETAGMEVVLEKLPFEDYTAALTAGNFDLYLGEVVLTADFDLSALVSTTGALNYGRWWDGEIDGLLAALRGAEGTAREEAAGALLAKLCEQVPVAPVCFKNGSVLTQWGRLSGLDPVRGNVFSQLENWIIR